MIGPSSSHTAGPARLGKRAREALGEMPQWADVVLYNSLADVPLGHGTCSAINAGLLGYDPSSRHVAEADDDYVRQHGLRVNWSLRHDPRSEPNTMEIVVGGRDRVVKLRGVSIGGGQIKVVHLEARANASMA